MIAFLVSLADYIDCTATQETPFATPEGLCLAACPDTCPFFTAADKKCYKECPPESQLVTPEKECVSECPEKYIFKTPALTCVVVCLFPYPFQDETAKTCANTCPAVGENAPMYQIDDNNVARCVTECHMNTTASLEFGDAKHLQCIAECPEYLYFTPAEGETDIGVCGAMCVAPTRFKDMEKKTCVKKCPTRVYDVNSGSYECLTTTTCDPAKRQVSDGMTNQSLCLPPCPEDLPITLFNLSCGTRCANPSIEVVYKNACSMICPELEAPFVKRDEAVDEYMCVPKCLAPQKYYVTDMGGLWKKCSECDLTKMVQRKWEDGSIQCLDKCMDGLEVLNMSDHQCLKRCPENTFKYNKACYEKCPEHYVPSVNNECVGEPVPKNQVDLTWLWMCLSVAGGVVLTCIVLMIITAMKKKKIDLVLADAVKQENREL